jgi:RNA polymerase sigma-70 factor, ECF subfamily
MASREQLVKENAEQKHVNRGTDGLPAKLLRARVFGRQPKFRGRTAGLVHRPIGKDFRDAEIEQLRTAIRRDEDVARLEIAVNDQVAVREPDSVAHAQENVRTRGQPETVHIRVAIHRPALDKLHHEVGTSIGGRAAVQNAGDVGMLQTSDNPALSTEALIAESAGKRALDHFQRDAFLKDIIRTIGLVYHSHPAFADSAPQRVGADGLAGEIALGRADLLCGRLLEKAIRGMRLDEPLHFRRDVRRARSQLRNPRETLGGRAFRQYLKPFADFGVLRRSGPKGHGRGLCPIVYTGRMNPASPSTGALLRSWQEGDQEAGRQVLTLMYEELRRLAAHYLRDERRGHTLQPTALVHELYLRLFSSEAPEAKDRGHLMAIAARQLRRLLVDYARSRSAEKRGGIRVDLDLAMASPDPGADIEALDEALTRLEKVDRRASQAVELRYFAGLSEPEAAAALGISVATLKRDWDYARAWLRTHMGG